MGYPYGPDNPFQDWYPARNNPNLDHATNEALYIAFQNIYALRGHVTTIQQQAPAPQVTTSGGGAIVAGGGGGATTVPLVVGFAMGSGATGTGLAYAVAPRAGQIGKCKILVTKSDAATDLTFLIKKNGTNVFTSNPTVTHGAAAGSLSTSTSLTSVPLTVAADDIFSIDVTSGTTSWVFTAQLET